MILREQSHFSRFFDQTTTSMKQTNNAIKFLMAQYRAIFKNAYFKGLTSAVLLTAGLAAAGTVQAASEFPINSGNMAYEYTISSDGTTWVGASDSGSSANDTQFTTSGSSATYVDKITISNGGTLSSDPDNKGAENLYIGESLIVNDGGKIELTGQAGSGGGIQGWNGTNSGSSASGALTVNAGGTVSVTQSQIQMGDISVSGEDATITVGGNIGLDESTTFKLGASGAITMGDCH